MPAPQPLSRDALRRLIGGKDYWNPNAPNFDNRQRQVREGFERLYPANGDTAAEPAPERDHLDDRDELMRRLRQRYEQAMAEYEQLLKSNKPIPPKIDKDGNLLRDYVPIPPNINDRMRLLNRELDSIRQALEGMGASVGTQYKLGD